MKDSQPNMMNNTQDFRTRLKNHSYLIFFLFLALIFLEWRLYFFPPKGYFSTAVIYLGSPRGLPPPPFSNIWQQLFYDDHAMLTLMEKAKIGNPENREKRLEELNSSIRQSLKFQIEEPRLVKITFTQNQPQNIKSFLYPFTELILKNLEKTGQNEFLERKNLLVTQLVYFNRQRKLWQEFLGSASPNLLIGLNSYLSPDFQLNSIASFAHEVQGATETHSTFQQIGLWFDNELDWKSLQVRFELQKIIEDQSGFPTKPIILSDSQSPAMPVQPFFNMILYLLPIAFVLLLPGLIFLLDGQGYRKKKRTSDPEKNNSGKSS